MRNAFLALLVANLVYFAWAHWIDTPQPATPNPAYARLPQLKLVEQSQRPQAGAEKMSLNQTCLSVGPFDSLDNTAHAAALLHAKGFDTRQRAEEGQMTEGFWVYIAGLRTQSETDHALETLERGGIKDALMMPETPTDGRRISLGLYSERARADRRAQLVRETGLAVEIADRKLPASIYWVDLTPPPGMSTVPLQGLFAEGVSSRIAVQPCPPAHATPAAPAPATGTAATTSAATTASPLPPPVHEPATASNPSIPVAGPPNLP